MWTQLRAAAIGAAACIGFAGVAAAQGASTQDPGTITPGNLSTQRLGPNGSPAAGANDSLGAVDLRNGNRRPRAGARIGTAPEYGTGTGGSNTATGARPAWDATRSGPSGAGAPPAIGGGR
jgi:hypothetical protein